MSEQNGNINKEIENLKKKPKRNFWTENYNNWNEKFTREIQSQIWVSRRIKTWR